MSAYTFRVHLETDPDDADRRVRAALADEGFGILTEIDVRATFRDKLDVEMRPYRILGACNPRLAHRAIGADEDIGALLPCNVVVRADPDGGTDVVAADPEAMMTLASPGEEVAAVAAEARAALRRALDAVAD